MKYRDSMHSALETISQQLGIPIVERCSLLTWAFDGKSIANHYDYLVGSVPDDPYEDGVCKYASIRIDFTEADLLHELGHYLAAAEEQRDLPEYGMTMGVEPGFGFGPYNGEFRDRYGKLRQNYWTMLALNDGLVDREEQNIQEKVAQLLSVYWGNKYNIPCQFRDWKEMDSWDKYFAFKFMLNDGSRYTLDNISQYDLIINWRALIRARQLIELDK